jgi:hypothetical protein
LNQQSKLGSGWKLRRSALFFLLVPLFLAPLFIAGSLFAIDQPVTLDQNYPNPFNGTTDITYSIPYDGHVLLRVYNMLGKEVQELVNQDQQASSKSYHIRFDGNDLPSGQYTYTLVYVSQGASAKLTRKMYLVK